MRLTSEIHDDVTMIGTTIRPINADYEYGSAEHWSGFAQEHPAAAALPDIRDIVVAGSIARGAVYRTVKATLNKAAYPSITELVAAMPDDPEEMALIRRMLADPKRILLLGDERDLALAERIRTSRAISVLKTHRTPFKLATYVRLELPVEDPTLVAFVSDPGRLGLFGPDAEVRRDPDNAKVLHVFSYAGRDKVDKALDARIRAYGILAARPHEASPVAGVLPGYVKGIEDRAKGVVDGTGYRPRPRTKTEVVQPVDLRVYEAFRRAKHSMHGTRPEHIELLRKRLHAMYDHRQEDYAAAVDHTLGMLTTPIG